jgi:uncharacterized protein (DUF2236 family)
LGRAPRSTAAAALTADPRLGFYGPGSRMWRINREAVLLGAGPTALLLQLAHPLVAEGVAQHSAFEVDPARRLRNTLRTTLALVFGDGPTATAAVRRLNRVHAPVHGDVVDPVARARAARYRAMDPDLLLWVQATLIWTSVQAYQRWVAPLTPTDLDAFWAEARAVGARLGIPLARSPVDWPAFETYWSAMVGPEGPVHVTPTGRRLGRLVLRAPLPFLPQFLAPLLTLPAVDLLPARIRAEYELPWGAGRARLAGAMHAAVRLWVGLLPSAWRALPQARAAHARAARVSVPLRHPAEQYDRVPHARSDSGRA